MMRPGTNRYIQEHAGLACLMLGPVLILLALLYSGIVPKPRSHQLIKDNWGNVASVWGLVVGFYVLVVAKGAKKAAQEVRDREILRTLLDNLEEANNDIRELGLFARESKWDIVYLKAVDALTHCREAISNWDDRPASRVMKNKLNSATTITRTIADLTANSSVRPPDDTQRENILRAQLDVGEVLGTVIGHIQKTRRKVTEP
jgi:hypothetical protein